ncbi:hypothetical protein [Winogradskyella sp.]|uniref:hypothetical protein n=1 Tax=Winogradskyella sp. TaxID=1883156 RepID=UPI002615150E|nr:hypothetical protein [Winogradskyella sp.]
MRIKTITYIVLFFPIILLGQQFPSPPTQSQINNHMMQQQEFWQREHSDEQVLWMMRYIQTNEQKLEREENKKTNLEIKIQRMYDVLSDLKDEILKTKNTDDLSNKKLQKRINRLNSRVDKTNSKIEKAIKKLITSKNNIKDLKHKIEEEKIRLEEKKKEKELKRLEREKNKENKG